jgi:hypothetical protein
MIKKVPWLRRLKKTDPEVVAQMPIACDAMSNGEGWWPDSPRKQLIRKLVMEKADHVARREGIDRREFLASACGTATALYMVNLVNGCSSSKDMPPPNNMIAGEGGSSGMSGSGGSSGMSGSGGSSGGGSGGSGGSSGGGSGGSGGGGSGGGGSGGMGGGGSGGMGGYTVPECAMEDVEMAECLLGMGGNELIIDMQSHFANTETNPTGGLILDGFISDINKDRFPWLVRTEGCDANGPGACVNRVEFVNQMFMGSDTTICVLSGISYSVGDGGMGATFAVLSNEDLIAGVNQLEMEFPNRMLSHAMVMPNDRLETQLAMMERLANQYTNWKTYPPWNTQMNASGIGYWLDGPEGQAMIQKGIDLGSPIFCIHKGFPLNTFSPTYCDPKDVGPAAVMFPEAYFVIYHSAFENGLAAGDSTSPALGTDVGWGANAGQWPEGPYDEALESDMAAAMSGDIGGYPLNRGVNSLIWSLRKAGIGPNGTSTNGGPTTNVYAECGGVWPNLMTMRTEEAMHYWGKLLKYIGEDRIVWGTDCLWFGSPQPAICAFRAFEISQEFQDTYGYPALTKERKAKILGQNAARLQNVRMSVTGHKIEGCHSDNVSMANLMLKKQLDDEWGPRRDMAFAWRGPRTRREFLKLRQQEHDEKVRLSGNFPNRIRV